MRKERQMCRFIGNIVIALGLASVSLAVTSPASSAEVAGVLVGGSGPVLVAGKPPPGTMEYFGATIKVVADGPPRVLGPRPGYRAKMKSASSTILPN